VTCGWGLGSTVELNHIAVPDDVVFAHLLTVELRTPPNPREFEGLREIPVNQVCDILDRFTFEKCVGAAGVDFFPRNFGINTNDSQTLKQNRADFVHPFSGFCGHGQCGITDADEFFENLDLVAVPIEVALVGDEQGRNNHAKRTVDFFVTLERRLIRIGNTVFFDTFDACERYVRSLSRFGNITYDGRPIIGQDTAYANLWLFGLNIGKPASS